MTPTDTNLGFVETIESLRIPIITEADQNKQCFYLSHDNLTVTLAMPCSDGSQVCFKFGKCASGEDIEESLVRDILYYTKAGKKLHQARLEDMQKRMQSALDAAGNAWSKGFAAGTKDAYIDAGLTRMRDLTITMLLAFAVGLTVGYFA